MSAAARHAFPGHCLALSHVALAAPSVLALGLTLGTPASVQFALFAVWFVCFLLFPTKPFKLTDKGRESRVIIYHTHLSVSRMVQLKGFMCIFL